MTVKQLDICSPPPAQSVVEDAEDLGVSAVALYACNWSVPGCIASRGTAQGVQAGGKLVVPIVTPSSSPGTPQAALSACQAWGLPCRVIMVDLEGPSGVDWPPATWVEEFVLLSHQAGLRVLGYAANTPAETRGLYAGCHVDYWIQGTLNDEETIPAGWDGNQYTDALRGPVSGTLYDCSVLSDELWAAMQPAPIISEEDVNNAWILTCNGQPDQLVTESNGTVGIPDAATLQAIQKAYPSIPIVGPVAAEFYSATRAAFKPNN